MVAVPADTPVTIPVVDPIVATPVLLLLQVPPPITSVSEMLAPMQKADGPAIAAGVEFTVTTMVTLPPHPLE
jgi:hypothetical protein